MKSLSKGSSSDAIFKLLKVTINTQQQIFAEALKDTTNIEDIATILQTDKKLFADEEEEKGVEINGPMDKEDDEDDIKLSYVGQ